jgi:hypothetical protein
MAKVAVTTEFLDMVVDQIQDTANVMSKQASFESKLPELVDTLIANNLVSQTKKAAILDKMKDPEYLMNAFAKVASLVSTPSPGTGVENESKKLSNGRESDRVFRQRILGR